MCAARGLPVLYFSGRRRRALPVPGVELRRPRAAHGRLERARDSLQRGRREPGQMLWQARGARGCRKIVSFYELPSNGRVRVPRGREDPRPRSVTSAVRRFCSWAGGCESFPPSRRENTARRACDSSSSPRTHDSNAVKVLHGEVHIGYISRESQPTFGKHAHCSWKFAGFTGSGTVIYLRAIAC